MNALLSDNSGARVGGTLSCSHHALLFVNNQDGSTTEFPLDSLSISRGGNAGSVLFFTHRDFPGITIHTSDDTFLDNPYLLQHPVVGKTIRSFKRQKRRSAIVLGSSLVGLALCFLLFWWIFRWAVSSAVVLLPSSIEHKIGEMVFRNYVSHREMLLETSLNEPFQNYIEPLKEAAKEETSLTFEIIMTNNPQLNAYALPGGYIVVFQGLLEHAESPEEFLSVVAHEMGHVIAQHSLKRILSSAGTYMIFSLVFGNIEGIAALFADLGPVLLTQQFSRDQEREADRIGLSLLEKSGIDPRFMMQMFQRLHDEQERLGSEPNALESLISSHPHTLERVEMIKEYLEEKGERKYRRPVFSLPYTTFKSRLKRRAP